MATTLLIAMASPLMRAGLQEVLKGLPGVKVVAQTGDAKCTLALIRKSRPEVLVCDSAISTELRRLSGPVCKPPRTLVLGPACLSETGPEADERPACGVLSDRAPLDTLSAVLECVAECCRPTPEAGACRACPLRASQRPPCLPLSTRELQVFSRIGRGQGPKAIAAELGLSVKTVESYRENIKQKLGLENAHHVLRAALAWERGEVPLVSGKRTGRSGNTT